MIDGKAQEADRLLNLGLMYYEGIGTAKNFNLAVKYFAQAAELGSPLAYINLGKCYFNGEGLPQDKSMGMSLICKVQELVDHPAIQMIIESTCMNLCVEEPIKYSTAEGRIFMSHADSGNAEAQYKLALCYERGTGGVEKNISEALKWYIKAANQNYPDALNAVGNYYLNGYGGLRENNEEAVRWYKKAVVYNHAEAYYNLAYCYLEGWGVEINKFEAARLFRKSAANGYPKAVMALTLPRLKGY